MRQIRKDATQSLCAHCQVISQIRWESISHAGRFTPFYCVRCTHCDKCSLFIDYTETAALLIYPLQSDAPPANLDMPQEIKDLYHEAAMIKMFSPRGAAAILRLCLQKICNHLSGSERSIADNLNALQKSADPIPDRFLKAAHAVRVIGNEAVHPGVIDFSPQDTDDTVNDLFVLINALVENQITQLKTIDAIIGKQPQPVKAKILKHQNGQGQP